MNIKITIFFYIGLYLLNQLFFVNSLQIDNNKLNNIVTLNKHNFALLKDEINDSNVKKCIRDLSKISSESFYVFIDSPGGSVNSGLHFINTLNWYKENNKVINCIAKKAHSMAFIIFQHCTNRYILSSTVMMQHQMSLSGIDGPFNNLMNYFDMVKTIGHEIDLNVANRIGISVEEYKTKISNDWWLYGNSIITAGVADKMIIVGCDTELYEISTTKEELVLDIDKDGMLDFKKINLSEDLCPL